MSRPEPHVRPLPHALALAGVRRLEGWLAALPDGRSWTRMDWVFGSLVAVLALGSTGFFTTTYKMAESDPDYFFHRLIASFETATLDLIETGAIGSGEGTEEGVMPAPLIRREAALTPADYEIVMIFADEVLLATERELMHAKVGSVLPGLGAMIAIDGETNRVEFENAILARGAP